MKKRKNYKSLSPSEKQMSQYFEKSLKQSKSELNEVFDALNEIQKAGEYDTEKQRIFVEKMGKLEEKQIAILQKDRRFNIENELFYGKENGYYTEDIVFEEVEASYLYWKFLNHKEPFNGSIFPADYYYNDTSFQKFKEIFEKRCLYTLTGIGKHRVYFKSLSEFIKSHLAMIVNMIIEEGSSELLRVPYLEDLFADKQLLNNFLSFIEYDDNYVEVYDTALDVFINDYYASLLYKNEEFNADNCIGYLPDKNDIRSYTVLFTHLLNFVFIFLQLKALSITPEVYLDKEGQINLLKSTIEKLKNDNRELQYDIEERDEKNAYYKEQIKGKDEIISEKEAEILKLKEEIENHKKTINRLNKENRLLEYNEEQTLKEYESIIDELKSGDKETKDTTSVKESEVIKISEKSDLTNNNKDVKVNYNGKYLFVIEQGGIEINNISNTFPNATFVNLGKVHTLHSLRKIDLVVIMTKYIKHATYYKIKEFCKQNDVPYVHCGTRNINTIIQCISDCYERKIIDKGD